MKILIVCGGTGGHIFPAISLAQELKERGHSDIVFVIDDNMRTAGIIEGEGFDFRILYAPKMPWRFSKEWIFFLTKLSISYRKARDIIREVSPDIVIGLGAYISWPVVSAANSFGIKTLIHEQNAVLGRANRYLLNKADRVCFSFNNKLLGKDKRFILTGNPLRRQIIKDYNNLTKKDAIAQLELSQGKKTILISGGSKGASAINELMKEILPLLDRQEKDLIQVIHLTGAKDLEYMREAYRGSGISYLLSDFYERMGRLYKAADLVLCRSGATTIAEISLFGLAAIFIPYPWAGSHQKENANILVNSGSAFMLEQADATPYILKTAIFNIIKNKDITEKMVSNIHSFATSDAARRLADSVEELVVC